MPNYRQLLIDSGALAEGHFVYASGKHGKLYVNKTAALVPASIAILFGAGIAGHFQNHGIEAVVAPELGAITLMTRVADALTKCAGGEVSGIIATKVKDSKEFEIGRDQARFLRGRRVLVIEDILTTGESAKNTVAAVRKVEGRVIAVAALWNRGYVLPRQLAVGELFSLVNEPMEMFAPEACPLCKAGIKVNEELGKGKEFLAEQAAKKA